MLKLSKWIMSHKIFLIVVFAVLLVGAIVGNLFVEKESDLISYLDKNSDTIVSKKILENEYDIIGDCNIAISYVTKRDVEKIIKEITREKSISNYLSKHVWIGTFDNLSILGNFGVDSDAALAKAKEKFVKTTTETFKTNVDGKLQTVEKQVDTYIISLYFETAGGSDETIAALDKIDEIITGYLNENKKGSSDGPVDMSEWYYVGGNAQNARTMLKSSLGDMPKFFIVAVLVCFVILFLSTQSYLEPLIFLATLGISILLNMGSNIIAGNPVGKISSITSSCATILQLAIAMDYSIFLMHTYYEELKLHPQPKDALIAALPKTFSAISASMLTTVGGFLALFFMDYGIGYDLGFVLAKGVIISLLSVVFLQPILILVFSKVIQKTKHKWSITPKLKFVSKTVTKPAVAIMVIIVVLGLALPCAYFQLKVPLNYISTTAENPNPTMPEKTALLINNQAIVLLPYDGPETISKHYDFVERTKKVGYVLDDDGNIQYDEKGKAKVEKDINFVTEVFSLATIISQEDFEKVEKLSKFTKDQVYAQLHNSFISQDKNGTGKKYMLYTVNFSNADENGEFENLIETDKTYNALKELKFIAMECFGLYNAENPNDPYVKLLNVKEKYGENSTQYETALKDVKNEIMDSSTSRKIYTTGLSQGAYELNSVTPSDFLLVSLLSAAIVLIILLFTFKKFKLSVILMLVIESGIWINLSLVYFASMTNPANKINFVAYLIVTAIELGATVDYAIMLTTKYLEEKKAGVKSVQSVKNAINRAAPSITTSACILIGVCACVHLITSNIIVAQITRLLAIGTTMSYVFVFTLLPAILSFDERIRRSYSMERGKGDPDLGRFDYNPNYYNEDGTPIGEIDSTLALQQSPIAQDYSSTSESLSEDTDSCTADLTADAESADGKKRKKLKKNQKKDK